MWCVVEITIILTMKAEAKARPIIFALHATTSLFRGNPAVDIHRDTYDAMALSTPKEPSNRDGEILTAFVEQTQLSNAQLFQASVLSPYWESQKPYNPVTVNQDHA